MPAGLKKVSVNNVKRKDRFLIIQACRACTKCLEEGKECIKVAAFVFTSDCEEGSKKAMETINQQVQDGSIEPELALMVALPDTIHVGKSLKCSFANWFIFTSKTAGEFGCSKNASRRQSCKHQKSNSNTTQGQRRSEEQR